MNGLPKEFQKDKELAAMKITRQEYLLIKQSLFKSHRQRSLERRKHIDGWFAGNKRVEYLEAVGNKDIKWFKNNCRCFMNVDSECPSCAMLRLFKEYK